VTELNESEIRKMTFFVTRYTMFLPIYIIKIENNKMWMNYVERRIRRKEKKREI
jgi:hypothetical protein